MSKYFKNTIVLLLITVIITLTGCMETLLTKEIPEEDLVIHTGRGCHTYTYSEKVMVCIDTLDDSLAIRTGIVDDYWFTILEGEFQKVAWYDYNIFVFKDNIYHVFDINTYEIPEAMYAEPIYVLKEYTESEMIELYPNYKSFDWYD